MIYYFYAYVPEWVSSYVPHVYRRSQGPKEGHFLWLELESVVRCHVSARNWTWVLSKKRFQRICLLFWPPSDFLGPRCVHGTHAKPMLIRMKFEWIFSKKTQVIQLLPHSTQVLKQRYSSCLTFQFSTRPLHYWLSDSKSDPKVPLDLDGPLEHPLFFLGICFVKCMSEKINP